MPYQDNSLAPALDISPGDEAYFETLDALNGRVTRESSGEVVRHLYFDNVNPATGPVCVASAEPGDALKITTHDIIAQTISTFDNLKQVMAAAGGTMNDVAQMLIYVTSSVAAAEMNAVYRT